MKYILRRRYECANGCLNATNDPDAYLPRDIFWLDEGKDYVVRRNRTPRRGRDYQRSDITYHRHEICGWVPVSWLCELDPVIGVLDSEPASWTGIC